jgi:hypothetical protein
MLFGDWEVIAEKVLGLAGLDRQARGWGIESRKTK